MTALHAAPTRIRTVTSDFALVAWIASFLATSVLLPLVQDVVYRTFVGDPSVLEGQIIVHSPQGKVPFVCMLKVK